MNAVVLLLAIAATSGRVSSHSPLLKSYDHALFLDEGEKYELLWSVDHFRSTISFATVVNTTGWVGFGIAKGLAGSMANSDIAIGFVTAKGKGHLVDRFATGNALPTRDEQQDFILTGSEENNGQTILRFNRSISACDKNDNSIQIGTTKLIYAYHTSDPQTLDDSDLRYHGTQTRGSRSVNLLNYVKRGVSSTEAYKHEDLVNKQVTVPKKDTVYWCTVNKVSRAKLGGKKHIVEIAPVITPGNEGLVHHIVITECQAGVLNDTHLNSSFECKNPNMPQEINTCKIQSILYAWAIGAGNFILPEKVGLPMGIYEETYYVIETHYDNPKVKEGIVDSSGLRFYYTDHIREFDGATLTTGMSANNDLIVPPGQVDWTDTAYCTPTCSKRFSEAPDGTLNVFAAFPHMHTAGRALSTRLIRNGKEVTEIIRDDNYDFNYQGDSLSTKCHFNTNSRASPTFGGESTRNEMCFTFLLYYPRIDVQWCTSQNTFVTQNFTAKHVRAVTVGPRTYYNWTGVQWTNEMTDDLKKVVQYPDVLSLCFFQNKSKQDYEAKMVRKPVVLQALTPLPDQCNQAYGSGFNLSSLLSLTISMIIMSSTSLWW